MSRELLNDEQLMIQVAGGDAAALEALYDRYASGVMGLAMKILGDRALAEEVVQETFWRAWRSADTFRASRGAFPSWLFGIARNLSIDLSRRRKVRPQPAFNTTEEDQLDRAPDLEANVAESAWAAVKHEQVRAAVKGLPSAQRQVIELAYFSGLTRQEIANATGEPLGTIHTRARLALQKLYEALRSLGIEE
jgi:RNA polymerase sigma-70 factor (ECF subfamily)